jgi:hypothetical protein
LCVVELSGASLEASARYGYTERLCG